MTRRQFIRNKAKILMALPLFGVQKNTTLWSMNQEIYRCKVGDFTCTIFKDYLFAYLAKDFFINADEGELKEALSRHSVTPDAIPSPFMALLLEDGNRKILVDTGIGFSEDPIMFRGNAVDWKGRLIHLLGKEQVDPGTITDVVITHFHPDHIGGVFSSADELLFPNATFHMHQNEWDFWHSLKAVNQPPLFNYFIEKNITPLRDRNINLIKGDFEELVAGVVSVNAEGHTEGQIALIIGNEGDRLLYISDAFLHPLHIEQLDWQTNYDLDHELARKTRLKLLDLAYSERMKIHAFHFDFPGLGTVWKEDSKWIWHYGS